MLFKGVVTLITRGFGQTVTLALEPYLVAGVNEKYLFTLYVIFVYSSHLSRDRTQTTPTFSTRV